MIHEDDDIYNWKTTLIHQSIPPLRWYANILGSIGSWAVLRCAFAEEDNRDFAAKAYGYIYSITMPTWHKYGSYYKVEMPIED